jgi:hypothetical protein
MERALWIALAHGLEVRRKNAGCALGALVADFARAACEMQLTDADMRAYSYIYDRLLAIRLRANLEHVTGVNFQAKDEHGEVERELELALEQLRVARFTLQLCENQASL